MSNHPIQYNPHKDFTTLEAWRKARAVKLFFYRNVIPNLPPEEKFNLGVQIRKASVSGTANIAEGYGRYYYKEGIQFYRVARGSIFELEDHLISCNDFEFVSIEVFEQGSVLIEEAKATINGYIKYVSSRKDNNQ